jgi:HTH-type transcriptional regulator, glycine betaine synthesis regulator
LNYPAPAANLRTAMNSPRSHPRGTSAVPDPGSGLVRGQGRPADQVAFDAQVVDFFVSAADLLGVPKSVAAIYGIVFASAEPLSFAEIEARLDISKGSISQGLRILREVGALKEVSADEDRAEAFVPDLELRKLVHRFLESRMQKQLDVGKGRLSELRRSIPGGGQGRSSILRQRLKSLNDWHRKASALLPFAKTFLKLGT